ncbi:MAG: PIN domain-containing protein, partial [Anaerolineae bacterium]|nr:PIN domain-containing protein [Anaerolineae bacterium]
MKAIDTNVLVRFLVNDEQKQAQAVRELFRRAEEQRDAFFVPLLVVLEIIWVLDSAYGIKRDEILAVLKDLLLLPILEFESRAAVQNMISAARNNNFDLPD